MAKVSITINGRRFAMGCDDGEEERLEEMAQKLDKRVRHLADQFGQIGDLRLMVMAGITLVDEIDEIGANAEARAEQLSQKTVKASDEAVSAAKAGEDAAINVLLNAAKRIEGLAASLTSP